ncbi:MAG TPA: pitrilysin family protein, partial [Candidatus Nanoarchaeia archaeon]|nr:pitrilysin family protein [Candidatus Nanoarchaeia archaeon]
MPETQSVTASIMIGVGSRYENYKINGGVSHFLEHILFKGTTQRPSAEQISREIDAVGGWNNAYTSNELTSFYIKVPRQHSALALDILSDMVKNPLFEADEIERERGVIVEEMNVIRDEPDRYVGNLLSPLLWPKDPMGYPVVGEEGVINIMPRQSIIDYKDGHYTAENIVVSVAGHISHEAVLEQVERQMGDIVQGSLATRPRLKRKSGELTNGLKRPTNQSHFLIGCEGYQLDHPDDATARVVSAILGRGMSSRLFLSVRERLGLAYSVYTGYESFTDTGIFEVYAGVNNDKVHEAIAEVLKELETLRSKEVEMPELIKAKNQLRGGIQMDMENNVKMSDQYGSELLLLNKILPTEEWLAMIDAVTP